jgi:cold shock CspA family protein
MGRSQETFSKKEREKKREKKRKDKAKRKEERKTQKAEGNSGPEFAYVDEFGRIVDTPPDPAEREEVEAEDIVLGVPPKEKDDSDGTYQGKVAFFNDEKGYGFITESLSQEKYFVHISNVADGDLRENEKVTFRLERGQKGMNAVEVVKV